VGIGVSMIQGVNGALSSSEIIHVNTEEAGSVETAAIADSAPQQQLPEDNFSIKLRQREPFTYSGSVNTGRCKECAYLTLRKLTVKILQDQHTASLIDEGEIETVVIDKITPEKAKALVANDGHWNPDQTADRIFSFALTISGNDRKKFGQIKECIIEGFQSAGESFGVDVPELLGKTLAATLNRLDKWAGNSGKP
jgi:hypothetical protein